MRAAIAAICRSVTDLPASDRRTLCVLLVAMATVLPAASAMAELTLSEERPVLFYDVSAHRGLVTAPNTKYGGPSVADFDNDGRYDIAVFDHNQTPVMFFRGHADGSFTRQKDMFRIADIHGVAPGDFDRDGDLDALISLGGGSGTKPQPPRMLRNDGEAGFTDVTESAGIAEMGARGRTVKWLDLDLDGYLDCVTVNAPQTIRPDWPRNIMYRNLGDGTFEYTQNEAFENIHAEKSLVTDYDGDRRPDLLTFGPHKEFSFYRGLPEMGLENVSEAVLPEALRNVSSINAVAQADIDGDGDLDYYLARGALIHDVAMCDDGCNRLDVVFKLWERPTNSLTFEAGNTLHLIDFSIVDRGHKMPDGMPIFLGAEKKKVNPPQRLKKWVWGHESKGFPETMDENGWYLGYLGDNQWKLAYFMKDTNLAWTMKGSIRGVASFEPHWEMNDPRRPDVLLRNDGGVFTDISSMLPQETGDISRGVTPGDFNNDGLEDFLVFRYGGLSQREPDVVLINRGEAGFEAYTNHGGNDLGSLSNGDMGVAFDYDLDGDVDVVSGDEGGSWRLFANHLRQEAAESEDHNYLLAHVGYSDTGFDPIGAKLTLTTESGTQSRVVGSGGTAFSQSLLNTVHFGLGEDDQVQTLNIVWRDGSEQTLTSVDANQRIEVGKKNP
ncbi:MAG: CRTAC1 family protein [Planctomycetota bacterium]